MSTAIEDLIKSTDRAFGRGTLMQADGSVEPGVEVVPTGSFAVDRALGIGGVPKGRIVEIYGPEACGKTTMALSIVAQAQKTGAVAAYIDAEHALELKYARDLGVDCSRMLLSQPDCGEQAMDVTEALVRSGQVGVIVIDSVAALTPKGELDYEVSADDGPGLQARLMSRAMRKLASLAHQTGTTLVFLNQLKANAQGVYNSTLGGNALKFYASARLDMRRIGSLTQDGCASFGQRVKLKVVKNKMAPPFRQVEVDLIFGKGFVREREVFDMAVMQGFIIRKGAFFRFGDELVGQGRERAIKEMTQVPELCERIVAALRNDEGEMY